MIIDYIGVQSCFRNVVSGHNWWLLALWVLSSWPEVRHQHCQNLTWTSCLTTSWFRVFIILPSFTLINVCLDIANISLLILMPYLTCPSLPSPCCFNPTSLPNHQTSYLPSCCLLAALLTRNFRPKYIHHIKEMKSKVNIRHRSHSESG